MAAPMLPQLAPQLAKHARPVLRKPPQGPPKRGDFARTGGSSSLPALLRAPAAYHSVHVYEHTHDHHHVVYRSQIELPQVQQQQTFYSNEHLGYDTGYSSYSSAPLLAHLPAEHACSNAEKLLSAVDPAFDVALASGWNTCGGATSSSMWVPPDESVSSRGGSANGDFNPRQTLDQQNQRVSCSNFPGASISTGLHTMGAADTATNWNRYQNAKERSRKDLARRPLWCPGSGIEDEACLQKRFTEMEQKEQWPQQRAFIQRQFKGLPDSKASDMKRRLVGDPRLHEKRDKQQIHKLKKEDIERDRDKARRIQGVMQQCSKSRHQLVRMQNQLRNADIDDRGCTRAESRHGNR